jgi:hypothetical protein
MASTVPWNIEADYLQACNCEYGCPCEFEAPPSQGFCEGVVLWRINSGRYGNVTLDGLCLGGAAHWPGPMHKGGGTCAWYIDEKASPLQRDALTKIASGDAGGMPFEIIRMTMAKVIPPQFVPIEFHSNGKHSRARFGQAISVEMEPIRNPVNGQEESIRIEHGTGFIFKSAEVVSGKKLDVSTGELKFSHPNKSGFVTRVSYHS